MLTVTVFDAEALCPTPSLTIIVTVYVPGSMYEWVAVDPLAVDPSPKLQA